MEIEDAISFLEEQIPDSSKGLPDQVFYFASKITPLVNVDLLIQDEHGRILLAWRDDEYAGSGWHLPGGVVRFKETLETRIQKVAETEVGTMVRCDLIPVAMFQNISESHDTRGHFIAFLYKCSLPSEFIPDNKELSETDRGYVKWHDTCPDNLLACQDVYRAYI